MSASIEQTLNSEWFTARLKKEIKSIEWGAILTDGFVSKITKVRVSALNEDGEEEHLSLMLKRYAQDSLCDLDMYNNFGLSREADFYNSIETMAPQERIVMEQVIPKIYYAESDVDSGFKLILMEDLSDGICPERFYSAENPFNAGKQALIQQARASFEIDHEFTLSVIEESFVAIAKVHAAFWITDRKDVARFPWARGSDWVLGEGREKWEKYIAPMVGAYDAMMEKIEDGSCDFQFSPGQ